MSAASILAWLWVASWQVALLAAVVLIAERLLARWLTPRWRHALWLVVMLRLLVPAQPEVPALAVDWNAAGERIAQRGFPRRALGRSERERSGAEPRLDPRAGEADEAEVRGLDAARSSVATATRPRAANDVLGGRSADPASRFEDERGDEPALANLAAEPPSPRLRWKPAVALAWAGVALALLLRDLMLELAFRRRLARESDVRDERVLAILEDCRARIGVRRAVRLVHTDLVGSPALYGAFRPRVLLPGRVLREFGDDELRHVLLHELAHHKRGDVLVGLVIGIARRLFWFHPVVPFASARLRAAQESARDWDALALDRDSGPLPYARTLLRLVEAPAGGSLATPPGARAWIGNHIDGRKALQARLMMITRSRRPARGAAFLGGGLVLALSWTALTTAAAGSEVGPPPATAGASAGLAEPSAGPTGAQSDAPSIRVERQSEPPAWRVELEEKLERTVRLNLRGQSLADAVDHLRSVAGINVVVDPELASDAETEDLWLFGELTVRQALELLLRQVPDAGWCFSRRAVFVASNPSLPIDTELRFYNVEPLIGSEEDDDDGIDDLMDIAMQLTQSRHGWDDDGTSIDFWRGLLVVQHTAEMHERVERVLNRMLRRGGGEEPTPAWREELTDALQRKISARFVDLPPSEIARELSSQYELPIVCPTFLAAMEEISLDLEDVTIAETLDWVADLTGVAIYLADGGVVFDEELPLEVEFFDVGGLVTPEADEEYWEVADGLDWLIRDHVDRESWEGSELATVRFWKGMLIVRQSRPVLEGVRDLLSAAERAAAPDAR